MKETTQAISRRTRTPRGAAEARVDAPAARTVQSLERAFLILQRITTGDDPPSLAEISRATGLHTSTAFHLIKTLIALGYVRQDDEKRYRVGPQVFVQAAAAFTEVGLVNAAMPFMRRLADATGETAHHAVPAAAGIAVVAKADARSSIRADERVGVVRPAHATGIGKMLLAALPQGELEAWLSTARLDAYTPRTITDPSVLRAELAGIARHGVAYDDGEFNQEVRCIAAPVRNYLQHSVAALGISGPIWRVTPAALSRLTDAVVAEAAALSKELGAAV